MNRPPSPVFRFAQDTLSPAGRGKSRVSGEGEGAI